MKTKHTTLPWKYVGNSWQYTTIYDGNNKVVATMDLEDWDVTEDNQEELEKGQQKCAEFIVRACNSHDELVHYVEGQLALYTLRVDAFTQMEGEGEEMSEGRYRANSSDEQHVKFLEKLLERAKGPKDEDED